jgi:DNA-binding cell septation regulator SpoVG
MSTMQIRDWRPMRKGNLLGFAKVELPSGMILNDVTILAGDRGAWASPPSKPMIDRDGLAIKDANGKLKYSPLVEFASKEVRDRFSATVIDALRASHPEALP